VPNEDWEREGGKRGQNGSSHGTGTMKHFALYKRMTWQREEKPTVKKGKGERREKFDTNWMLPAKPWEKKKKKKKKKKFKNIEENQGRIGPGWKEKITGRSSLVSEKWIKAIL